MQLSIYSAYKSLNLLVNLEQVKLSTDIEKNPGPSAFVDATKTIHAPYFQRKCWTPMCCNESVCFNLQ